MRETVRVGIHKTCGGDVDMRTVGHKTVALVCARCMKEMLRGDRDVTWTAKPVERSY